MAGTIKAILIDDEKSARDVLANLLMKFCPSVEVLDQCADVMSAKRSIEKHHPDLVFLDIEMPRIAGHEILKHIDEIDFEIVFVTAYDHYAIKAFEVAAIDYLLKPIDIDRLVAAVQKVVAQLDLKKQKVQYDVLTQALEERTVTQLVISEGGYHKVVAVDEIIAIEAQESYSKLHTTSNTFLASKNLKHFETVLEENQGFFRCHKSWIVNFKHVVKYQKTAGTILLNQDLLARLSKYRKEAFELALQRA